MRMMTILLTWYYHSGPYDMRLHPRGAAAEIMLITVIRELSWHPSILDKISYESETEYFSPYVVAKSRQYAVAAIMYSLNNR